jgi:hypothetical protein
MRNGLKIIAAIAIIVLTVSSIIIVSQPKEETPVRETSPVGYEEYAQAIDPEFCKTVALQLAALGDDPALGFRSAGSPAEEEAAELLAQTMKDIGLENVTVDEAAADGWTFNGANITFKDKDGTVTTAVLGGYQTNLVAENETLPLVYLDRGTAADYEGTDVTGKLVLIDIDQENEWWINYPAYQAYLKGARAVVACSLMEEEIDERIGSQDICGDANASALAISAADSRIIRDAIDAHGYETGGVKQIDVILNAKSEVTMGKGTRNLWGEIPGETDDVIMFIAHYDGYYHSFYDDASGVGMTLGIAKALREGGVKPEKTFRFVLHGAEEWGRSGTESVWATGAFEQIVNVSPEWAEHIFALFNIDSGYPLDAMRSFEINAPAELGDFVRSCIASFGDRSEVTVSPNITQPSAYREDFIYNAYGAPTFAVEGGEGDKQYYASMYHSNMDDLAVGGYNVAGVLGVSRYIGYSALLLDSMPLRPLRFTSRLELLKETLTDQDEPVFEAHLLANLERALVSARSLDSFISDFNAEYRLASAEAAGEEGGAAETDDETAGQKFEDMKKLAADINDGIYAVYREMQDELLRLDRNLSPGFANEGLQRNIGLLDKARDALMDGDPEAALYSYLSEIESVYASTAFDRATCDTFMKGLDESVEGTWAEGRLVSKACRADDVVRSLLKSTGVESANALYGVAPSAAPGSAGATIASAAGSPGAVADSGESVSGAAVGEGEAVSGAAAEGDVITSAGAAEGDETTSAAVTGDAEDEGADASFGWEDDEEIGEETSETADEASDFLVEIRMLGNLIRSQENILKAVYNEQEDALAGLTESMNELLDTYASDKNVEGIGV